jgi:transposase, IS5 family
MSNLRYKSTGNKSLFDEQFSPQKLEEIGNPLAMVSKVIDFEIFRDLLESKLLNLNKKIMQGQNLMI